jgi:hypothetical protein
LEFHAALDHTADTAGAAIDFRFLFAYSRSVASSCRVSFEDGAGVAHTVLVSASSLYEAAVLAIVEFKRSGFAIGSIGTGTRLTVAVELPTTTHELSVGKLQSWLDAAGKTPKEQAKKVTLRLLLNRA